MSRRLAPVENGCEEEEEYPQEEQMDAEESTETRKLSKCSSFSSILISEKYSGLKYIQAKALCISVIYFLIFKMKAFFIDTLICAH